LQRSKQLGSWHRWHRWQGTSCASGGCCIDSPCSLQSHEGPFAPPPLCLMASVTPVAFLLHSFRCRSVRRWADRVLGEFFAQGDRERAVGLPIRSARERPAGRPSLSGHSPQPLLHCWLLPPDLQPCTAIHLLPRATSL
jgi:hypothetical protein